MEEWAECAHEESDERDGCRLINGRYDMEFVISVDLKQNPDVDQMHSIMCGLLI